MSSYIVLARKWRPRVFEEVVGQNHVTKTLQNALKNNRLAHALLFCGARGVGKTTVARILSRAINCPNSSQENNFNPCNKCDICTEILSGASVDIIEIDGASNRGIDEIRQIRENIKFYPVRTKFKVYIIDEVHMLTKEAFNALLKTLEEPPKHIYFIMATTEPQKIPQTILSRCQRYDFRKLTLKELSSHLRDILNKEHLEITDEAVNIIAREAGGSVRDAMSLLDKVVAFGALTGDDVCNVLGISGLSTVTEAVKAIFKRDLKGTLELIERLDTFGADYNKFLNDLVLLLRDLLVVKKLGDDSRELVDLVDLNGEFFDELKIIIQDIPEQHILLLISQIMEGIREISRSNIPRISMEVLLMKLCYLDQLTSVDDLIRKLEEKCDTSNIEKSLQVPLNEKQENLGSSDTNISPNISPKSAYDIDKSNDTREVELTSSQKNSEIQELTHVNFRDFINHLKKKHPLIASLLLKGDVLSVSEDGTFVINPTTEFISDFISDSENINKIKEIAKEFFKREVNIKIKKNNDSEKKENGILENNPNEKNKIDVNNTKNMSSDVIENEPFVKKALEIFSAKIYSIEKLNKTDNNSQIE